MSQEDVIARAAAGLARAVFTASDLVFGPWIFPNLVGVLGLSGVVARLLRTEEAEGDAALGTSALA